MKDSPTLKRGTARPKEVVKLLAGYMHRTSLRHLFELPEPRRVLRGKRVDVQQQQLAWQVVRPPLPANEPEREEMLPPLCPVFPQESLRGSGEW